MTARGEMDCLTENTVLDFLDGTLSAADLEEVERHLDGCPPCRRLAGELGWALSPPSSSLTAETAASAEAAEEPAPLVRGSAVGRYLVIQPLGAGGQSAVYVAYDPELDRRVALKLVRPDVAEPSAREELRARLLREAQALARLTHPNVTAVHDAGSYGDQVFIAMELVPGRTLAQWLRDGVRGWRQVVAMFRQAGAGLAAAHAAGVIHRDFKPANVLVGEDGQVRVADFGLARVAGTDDPPEAGLPSPGGAADELLTQQGRVLGTPAYMAPEQHAGRTADARADQFSFCVALHEALCGERPARTAPAAPLTGAVTPAPPRAPGRTRDVPARLRRVVRRGLREAPADRYPSMAALLADLDRRTAPRWRAPLVVAALAGLLAAGGVAYRARVQRERDRCAGVPGQLADVWDAGRRRTVRAAFLATGRPDAAAAFARVAERLDAQAAAWVAARTAACAGTRATGPAGELAALRAQCLDWQLEEIRGFTDVLAQADGAVAERASDIADRFIRLDRCAVDARLARPPRAPTDPQAQSAISGARARLVRAKVLVLAGKFGDAERTARAVAAAARAVGFRPLEAEAHRVTGFARMMLGQLGPAEDSLWQAVYVGESCGHDEPVAEAWADLAWLTGVAGARRSERLALAERYGRQATAVAGRGSGDTFLEGKVHHTLGVIAMARGRYAEAEHHARAALEAASATRAGQAQIPSLGQLRGNALAEQGRVAEGLALHEQALTAVANRSGCEHPCVARYLVERAALLAMAGRHDDALAAAEATLELARRGTPPQQEVVAQSLDVAGQSLAALGRHEAALAHHREALQIFSRSVGADDARPAVAREHVGTALRQLGRHAAALAELEPACALLERSVGPAHPLTAGCYHELARTLLAQARPSAALPILERTLTIRQQASVRPADVAATRFALAEALWAAGRDPARARELVALARAGYAQAEGDHRGQLAAIERWLAAHGPR